MPSKRVPNYLNNGTYFITLTVTRWYYLFDRHNRWQILAGSLNHFQKTNKIELLSFVFMLNHIHIIIRSGDVSGFIRDFKKFTSKKLKENIKSTEPHILKLFLETNNYKFWQNTNMPIYIYNQKILIQKKRYIENNPVKKEYVCLPQYWYWSSANDLCELRTNNSY